VVDVTLTGDVFDVSCNCETGDVVNFCAVDVVATVSMPSAVGGVCTNCEVDGSVFCGTLDVVAALDVRCCMTLEVCVTGDVLCDDDVMATG